MHSSQPHGFAHFASAALQEPPLQTRKFVYSGVPEQFNHLSVRKGPSPRSCSKRSSLHRRGGGISDQTALPCEVNTQRHRQAANYIFKSTNKRICVLGDTVKPVNFVQQPDSQGEAMGQT